MKKRKLSKLIVMATSLVIPMITFTHVGASSVQDRSVSVEQGSSVELSKPSNLSPLAVGSDFVELSWDVSFDSNGMQINTYDIYRNGEFLGQSHGNSYMDIGLDQGTNYVYTVQAVDGDGNKSEMSDELIVRTEKNNVEVGIQEWNSEITYKQGDEVLYGGIVYIALGESIGQIPENSLLWQVLNEASVELSKPSNLRPLGIGDNFLEFTWDSSFDSTGMQINTYDVYRDGEFLGQSHGNSYMDMGLEQDINYVYTVQAVDGDGNKSEMSDELSITLESQDVVIQTEEWQPYIVYELGQKAIYEGIIFEALGQVSGENPLESSMWKISEESVKKITKPSNFRTGVVEETYVDLMWDASKSSSEISHYTIYRDGVEVVQTQELMYTDIGLTKGTMYNYEVEAVDINGVVSERTSLTVITRDISSEVEVEIEEWNPEKLYRTLDVVTYDGEKYIATRFNISEPPNSSRAWRVLN